MHLDEIAGNIMVSLCKITGTKTVRNDKDIPVIFKYVGRLSSVNKHLYSATNSTTAVQLFLTALSSRFQQTEEHWAAVWNTHGARAWLWNYVQTNEHYEVYKKIFVVWNLIGAIEKKTPLGDEFTLHSLNQPPYFHQRNTIDQTKRSLCLGVDGFGVHLATPFGEAPCYRVKETYAYSKLCQSIIGHLADILETPTVIVKNSPMCTYYKIRPFPNETLKEPSFYSSLEQPRSGELTSRMLEMCMTMTQGNDPIEKPPRVFPLQTSDLSPPSFTFNSIRDVQPWYFVYGYETWQLQLSPKKDRLWGLLLTSISDRYQKMQQHNTFDQKLSAMAKADVAATYVITCITHFWQPATLSDFPAICDRESEEEWGLYIHIGESPGKQLTEIILALLPLLGIKNVVRCSDRGIDKTYLWIRKDAFESVKTKLNLFIQE